VSSSTALIMSVKIGKTMFTLCVSFCQYALMTGVLTRCLCLQCALGG